MGKVKSTASKLKEGRGTGDGFDYKPFIEANEFNSLGTCSNPIDWKTGRTVHLLSQGEAVCWYLLRWNDNVIDIREQYPLPLDKTIALAKEMGIPHPRNKTIPMTTDFYVTLTSRESVAISVKPSPESWCNNPRATQLLALEKMYWLKQGIRFMLVHSNQLNRIKAHNIRVVSEYYHKDRVHDTVSLLKHLIATKKLLLDIDSELLNFSRLSLEYAGQLTENQK